MRHVIEDSFLDRHLMLPAAVETPSQIDLSPWSMVVRHLISARQYYDKGWLCPIGYNPSPARTLGGDGSTFECFGAPDGTFDRHLLQY